MSRKFNHLVRLAGVTAALLACRVVADERPAAAAAAVPAKPTAGVRGAVIAEGVSADGGMVVMLNKSRIIKTRQPYQTVNVANPAIADVNRVGDLELLVTAKKPGHTQLVLWDVGGRSQNVDVTVSGLESLQSELDKMFPGAGVKASDLNGTIALRGRVKNKAVAKQVEDVARPYGEDVLNLLEIAGGQQVMLQVRFAEVSRNASSQLGFNGFATDGNGASVGLNQGAGASPIGGLATGAKDTIINPAVTVFGSGKIGSYSFEVFLQALRRNSLLRVLAEPNVIAISGEQASFLAGGEFPIPIPQDGGAGAGNTITVQYKQFGVKLNFVPEVLGDGRIRLKVEPEVSDLDYSRSVSFNGFVIPGLTKRTLTTTIELNEGQSFAVAGLLNNRIVANKDVTPLLGDLPIIGTLFRSVRYERSETELVVIVTPRLVDPLNPGEMGDLPGEKWTDPKELQLFLDKNVGSIGDGAAAQGSRKPAGGSAGAQAKDEGKKDAEPARFLGQYGFVAATN
jgi:pilus assembly protein CpaC